MVNENIIKYELVPNEEKYWNFIGKLRADSNVQHGFVEKLITFDEKKQSEYMKKYNDCYWVCKSYVIDKGNKILYERVGFVGVVDNDIRVCVAPVYHQMGIGKFMINELKKVTDLTNAIAKVKLDNEPSHKLFLSCGYEQIKEDENFKYYKLKQ
jgi:RimJ/RimL family protein N-acetyltransferase